MTALAVSLVFPSLTAAQGVEPATTQLATVSTERTTTLVVAPVAASAATPIATQSGPRLEPSRLSRSTTTAERVPPAMYHGERRDVAWMIIGGATLVVGSMVDGDGGTIMMITGGVIGLMGLWRYMQ